MESRSLTRDISHVAGSQDPRNGSTAESWLDIFGGPICYPHPQTKHFKQNGTVVYKMQFLVLFQILHNFGLSNIQELNLHESASHKSSLNQLRSPRGSLPNRAEFPDLTDTDLHERSIWDINPQTLQQKTNT